MSGVKEKHDIQSMSYVTGYGPANWILYYFKYSWARLETTKPNELNITQCAFYFKLCIQVHRTEFMLKYYLHSHFDK